MFAASLILNFILHSYVELRCYKFFGLYHFLNIFTWGRGQIVFWREGEIDFGIPAVIGSKFPLCKRSKGF